MVVGYILGGGYCQFDDTFNLISVYHTSKCCSKKKKNQQSNRACTHAKKNNNSKTKNKKAEHMCV